MKIMMVAPETRTVPPILGGGVETWIYETSKYLTQNDIFIFCPQAQLQSIESSYHITYVRAKKKTTSHLIDAFASRFLPSIYSYPYVRALTYVCKEIKPDIVHIHNRPQFLEAFQKRKNKRCSIILQMHNEIKPYLPVINSLSLKILHKADAIIAVSRYLKKSILKEYPQINPDKIYVLYNGADINRFKPRSKEELANVMKKYGIPIEAKVILYVGRLIPEKGVHLLVSSFQIIKKNYRDAILLIVGGANFAIPSETAYVKFLKAKAGNNVIFTGWVPHEVLPYLYALSDIFVFPAVWNDVSPLPIYEAQASGIPVVGSNRGGIPEIVLNNTTGIIIEPTIENIANAILYLLHNDDERKKMGMHARKRAEEYLSWNRVAKELQKIYERICYK